MKSLFTLLAAAAITFSFAPTESRAGECYRSKIHSSCGHCGHNILSYYRPVRTVATRVIYGWVPSYHSSCGTRLHGNAYGHRHVYGGSNFRFSYGVPNYHNYGYGAGVQKRSVGVHRYYPSGRVISTYPQFRMRRSCR